MVETEDEKEARFLKGEKVTFGIHRVITLPKDPKIEKLELEVTSVTAQVEGECGQNINIVAGTKQEVAQGKTVFIHQNCTSQLCITLKDN
jgi:hypothetical protein